MLLLKKIALIACLLSCFLSLAPGSLKSITAPGESTATHLQLAQTYEQNGDIMNAIAEYDKLLNDDPDSAWVRQQIIRLTRQKLQGPGIQQIPDVLLFAPRNSRCAIVEKESQTLLLYHSTDKGCELEKVFACSTGAQQGEKLAQGDERTPEGIYFFQSTIPRAQLPEKYGNMAITLDYPNAYDRLEGKGGGGIWLHATNEPIRPYLPNKTRGCVVISNEDIEELAPLIELNRTPLVIVQKIRYPSNPALNKDLESLTGFLNEWRSCWENKQLDRYISLYSTRFRNGDHNVHYWKSYKDSIFSRAGKIRLTMRLQSVVRESRYAALTFDQEYQSDRLISKGLKRLFVVQEGGGWKIISEEMITNYE